MGALFPAAFAKKFQIYNFFGSGTEVNGPFAQFGSGCYASLPAF